MSVNNALNKADNIGKLDIKGILNPDSIPNAKDADFSGSLEMTNNFIAKFWKGWWKSEVRNQAETTYGGVTLDPNKKYSVCDKPLTKTMGTKSFNWHKETYYTTNPSAKPHFNMHRTACKVEGVHRASWDGTIRDKDGFIVVACNGPRFGTKVMTSLWPWKIYDRWWMKSSNHYDIFTSR